MINQVGMIERQKRPFKIVNSNLLQNKSDIVTTSFPIVNIL